MNTRTYRGKEIGALLSQIRREHGDEVCILETRELQKNVVEIDVAIGTTYGDAIVHENAERASLMVSDWSESLSIVEDPNIEQIVSLFESQGLSEKFIRSVKSKIATNIRKPTADIITDALSKFYPLESRLPLKKNFVAFVGPTGAGKTTTIAKIAARMRLAFDVNIALISADCFRVGAGYQLQTYASLMHLPCRVLEAGKDLTSQLASAMHAFKDYDLVFIDAAGFSPREKEKLAELESCFHDFDEIERILLLPAPGNTPDLLATVKAFSRLGIDRTIITKLDESGFIGPVMEAALVAGRPLAFFTTGQRVPEDIEPASLKRLTWRLQTTVH